MSRVTRERRRVWPAVASAAAAALLVPAVARAHAPPEATGIAWYSDGTHERNVVRTNRGLIVTEDAGATFRLVCNDAFGAGLTETAPMAFTEGGRLLLASYQGGLQSAAPDLCSFDRVGGALQAANVADIAATSEASPRYFMAATLDGNDDHLFVSGDTGKSFEAPSSIGDFVFSLSLSPSNPSRLYAATLHASDAGTVSYRVLVSSDAGASFVAHDVALTESEIGLRTLGVDPTDPDRAFLRTVPADLTANERVLRTDDAGKSFVEVTSLLGPTYVAATADGSTLFIGDGDGVLRSTDHGKTFTRSSGAAIGRVQCLATHGSALFACALRDNEFGVLVSRDGGASFSWYLRFPDVKALVDCPSDSATAAVCAAKFPDWKLEQGLRDASAPVDGSSAPDAGSGAPPPERDAGPLGAGEDASVLAPPHGKDVSSESSCAVGSVRGSRSSLLSAALGAIVALAALRRRRH